MRSRKKIAIFEKESTTPLSIVLALDASESVFSDRGLEREAAKGFPEGAGAAAGPRGPDGVLRQRG